MTARRSLKYDTPRGSSCLSVSLSCSVPLLTVPSPPRISTSGFLPIGKVNNRGECHLLLLVRKQASFTVNLHTSSRACCVPSSSDTTSVLTHFQSFSLRHRESSVWSREVLASSTYIYVTSFLFYILNRQEIVK